MKAKRLKTCLEVLFTIGLCLAVLVMIVRRYALIPDFYCGLLAGISVTLLLGAGSLKYLVGDKKTSNEIVRKK